MTVSYIIQGNAYNLRIENLNQTDHFGSKKLILGNLWKDRLLGLFPVLPKKEHSFSQLHQGWWRQSMRDFLMFPANREHELKVSDHIVRAKKA